MRRDGCFLTDGYIAPTVQDIEQIVDSCQELDSGHGVLKPCVFQVVEDFDGLCSRPAITDITKLLLARSSEAKQTELTEMNKLNWHAGEVN